MKKMCMMMVMLACANGFADNIQMLTSDEQKVGDVLDALQWKADLSAQENCVVTNALQSTKEKIAELALCVAVVHDLSCLKEMPQSGIGPSDGWSRILSKAVVDGIAEGRSPIDSLRSTELVKKVPKDAQAGVREKAAHIIAVSVVRTLRRGKTPIIQWEDLPVSSVDKQILQYSKQPSEEVTRRIIRQLGQASVAGGDEYDLVRVLDSYEDVNVDAILDAFRGDGTGVYGKILLLVCIESRASKMTDEERKKAKSVLGKDETKDKRVERALKRVEMQLDKTPQKKVK